MPALDADVMTPTATTRPPRAARAARPALAAALLLVTACVTGTPTGRPAPTPAGRPAARQSPADEAEYLRGRRLMVPVEGIAPSALRDNFDARRSGGRSHNALDIMAPRGTPVLAADAGRVLKIRENRLGGLTIYLVDEEERFVHYYAHLDRYREGLREGQRVARGELLGYVGTTGNAPRNAPHLHFQLMRYDRKRWWDGAPVNPHPFLAQAGERADARAQE